MDYLSYKLLVPPPNLSGTSDHLDISLIFFGIFGILVFDCDILMFTYVF